MKNEILFLTQISSVLGFIITVFFIYRLYTRQQKATIKLLKEKCDYLTLQLKHTEKKEPDKLVESLSNRIKVLNEELERLIIDKEKAEFIAEQKKEDIASMKQGVMHLQNQLIKLSDLSFKDGLTSLFNRHYMNSVQEKIFKEAYDGKQPLTIMLIDIDRFKRINDEYGHQFGDKILQELSNLISVESGTSDIVIRYGGEEIILLMPKKTSEEAYELAERIQIKLSEKPTVEDVFITCSYGISSLIKGDKEFSDILSRADFALHHAKSNGRNTIHISYE